MNNYFDLSSIDLNTKAPTMEPERQYYFMAKCKELVDKITEEKGRAPLFCIHTLGCQMNAKDSEKLEGILEEIGYQGTEDEKEADFVLYNTCTVRENANQKVYGRLGYLNTIKRKHPDLLIALCGCMMQEADEVQTVREKYRFVDMVFGTHNIFKLAEILYRRLTEKHMIIDVWEGTEEIVEDLPAERKYSFKSGVNIMYGCNNFCSYCIVPYVRGRERSREAEDILKEIKALADDGVVEVMLLGQNVNSYGKTLKEPVSFAHLLELVEEIPGIERIRFMTSHPKDLSDELIEVMAKSKKICKHFHLPLQAGSNTILKAMNRHYTKERYLEIAKKLREAVPGIALTTDIIVGFPGETEEDFQETIDVVKQVKYDSAFTFIYSKRTGTPAASMDNQVPEDVIKDRFDRLLSIVQELGRESAGKDVGTVQYALVEEINRQQEGYVTGRLSNNSIVHFKGDENLIGKILPVKLVCAKGFYYMGELSE